jgi:periplasmic divalent cation tolerance protein
MDAAVVTTTLDDRSVADALAAGAVEGRYAACVQLVGPIVSTYRWQGRVETATEWQLQCKTAPDRVADLVGYLSAGHPYDVPEVVVTPVVGGHPAYLAWVRAETRSAAE